ncbi:hypothetical protein C8J57DRAFT_1251314 [Mycena rebaudengoi]|nr:hypothetical protein C8J57DRAFT_1251314 [Mycena rebaudengoi]
MDLADLLNPIDPFPGWRDFDNSLFDSAIIPYPHELAYQRDLRNDRRINREFHKQAKDCLRRFLPPPLGWAVPTSYYLPTTGLRDPAPTRDPSPPPTPRASILNFRPQPVIAATTTEPEVYKPGYTHRHASEPVDIDLDVGSLENGRTNLDTLQEYFTTHPSESAPRMPITPYGLCLPQKILTHSGTVTKFLTTKDFHQDVRLNATW